MNQVCEHCQRIRVSSARELPALDGVTIVAERGGVRVPLGGVSAETLETIALIVDAPVLDADGGPVDRRELFARLACEKV